MPGIILFELEDSLNGSISGEVHLTYNIPTMMKTVCSKSQSVVERQRKAMVPMIFKREKKKELNRWR